MNLFYVLLILLFTTRAFGEVAERLGQPALVGELIAGITLGAIIAQSPSSFPDLTGLANNEVFVAITDLGMFFIMLYAGVEMQPHKMFQHSAGSLVVALGGMVVPLGLGAALGWYFLPETEMRAAQCLFIGTALAITAVPATVRILIDLGRLDTPVGQTIVSAAVFDDVLSLALLAWLTGMITASEQPSLSDIAILLGKIIVFFVITAIIGLYIFPWGGRFMRYLKTQELEISAMLVGAFAFAVLAEMLGMNFIVGAFVAGLYFGRRTIDEESYDRVRRAISALTFGFLSPIFFASIGLNLDFHALFGAPVFVFVLILVAFFGKVIGAGYAARAFGFSTQDAIAIGVGMSPRGAVELVIASIAMKAGLFSTNISDTAVVQNLFSGVVIMAVVTTAMSPIILKMVFARYHGS